jgi:hypothetical protein
MRNALIIGFDESITVVDLDSEEGSYNILSNAVDGYIEAIRFTETLNMYINEEGKLNGLMVNPMATAIFQTRYGKVDIIVGNAVLTGGVDEDGEDMGLSDEQVERFKFIFTK